MVSDIELIVLSFLTTLGFAVVFHIEKKLLIPAALGSVVTRVVLILMQRVTDSRIIYMLLAAMAAALYAEILATFLKRPSTVFLYPSIIPLIPGDLLYYSIVYLLVGDSEKLHFYGPACLQAVIGMALGFVLISTLMHYRRLHLFRRLIRKNPLKQDE